MINPVAVGFAVDMGVGEDRISQGPEVGSPGNQNAPVRGSHGVRGAEGLHLRPVGSNETSKPNQGP